MAFRYVVDVTAETAAQAGKVMAERLNHDEVLGFDYSVEWHAFGNVCTCGDTHSCGFCYGEAEELIGQVIRDSHGRAWVVREIGEKDDLVTLDGEECWTYFSSDYEVLGWPDEHGFVPCQECDAERVDPQATGADGRSVCDGCRTGIAIMGAAV
jgi:hypothetical protein